MVLMLLRFPGLTSPQLVLCLWSNSVNPPYVLRPSQKWSCACTPRAFSSDCHWQHKPVCKRNSTYSDTVLSTSRNGSLLLNAHINTFTCLYLLDICSIRVMIQWAKGQKVLNLFCVMFVAVSPVLVEDNSRLSPWGEHSLPLSLWILCLRRWNCHSMNCFHLQLHSL